MLSSKNVRDLLQRAYLQRDDVLYEGGLRLLGRLEEVLAAHRRFHGKAGCPGRPECYVCAEEEWLELQSID